MTSFSMQANNKQLWYVSSGLFFIVIIGALHFYPADIEPEPTAGFNKSISSSLGAESPLVAVKPSTPSAQASAKSFDQPDAEQLYEQWLIHIQTSTRTVDQIARVISGKDTAQNIITLKSLLEADPQNLLLHYLLAQNCLRKFNAAVCKPVDQSALAIFAADNGLLGDLKFVEAHKLGDPAAALTALNDAGHTAHTDNFYGEQFAALTESMAALGFRHDVHLIDAAIGIMAAETDNIYSDMMTVCRQQTQRQWQDTCYARGIALAEHSINDYPKMIGLQLIKNTGRTKEPRYENLAEQYRQYQTYLTESLPQWESARTSGFQLDDNQWQEFLVICQSQGEAAAKRYLMQLISR